MIIKGAKTILRPIRMSDAERFVVWLSDPAINRFTNQRQITLREERAWISGQSKKRSDRIHFAIDTADGIHIGSCGFHEINQKNHYGVLGIIIGDQRFWNKGYGTDVMRSLLRYGFQKRRLHRIALFVYAYNPRAIRVYEKLGFKKEGVHREEVYYRGKYYDKWCMGILRNEWMQRKDL